MKPLWYEWLLNLRAALERRGDFISSDNLLKGVYQSVNTEQVHSLIERYRVQKKIPRIEVYGKEDTNG
jgi:hypothetical protein